MLFAIAAGVFVLCCVLTTVVQYRKWKQRYEEDLERRNLEKLARANFAAGEFPDLEKFELQRGRRAISQLNKKIEDLEDMS